MKDMNRRNKDIIRRSISSVKETRSCDHPLYFSDDLGTGWKVSIQGKSHEDTLTVFDAVFDYLIEKELNAKFALTARHKCRELECEDESERIHLKVQSHKITTIYCSHKYDILDVCEDIDNLLRGVGYNGWVGIQDPNDYSYFSDGVYYRNDTNENGKYIAADNSLSKAS